MLFLLLAICIIKKKLCHFKDKVTSAILPLPINLAWFHLAKGKAERQGPCPLVCNFSTSFAKIPRKRFDIFNYMTTVVSLFYNPLF